MSTWIASQDTFLQAEPEPERLVQAVSRRAARGIQFDARETGFVGVDKDILVGLPGDQLLLLGKCCALSKEDEMPYFDKAFRLLWLVAKCIAYGAVPLWHHTRCTANTAPERQHQKGDTTNTAPERQHQKGDTTNTAPERQHQKDDTISTAPQIQHHKHSAISAAPET
ncbi:hypothetical protein BD560DRAFT_420364 [Blakeslea trispora]|nr:hypothetical protein BD560DRAFT_420364 [Blakeslea trispora]